MRPLALVTARLKSYTQTRNDVYGRALEGAGQAAKGRPFVPGSAGEFSRELDERGSSHRPENLARVWQLGLLGGLHVVLSADSAPLARRHARLPLPIGAGGTRGSDPGRSPAAPGRGGRRRRVVSPAGGPLGHGHRRVSGCWPPLRAVLSDGGGRTGEGLRSYQQDQGCRGGGVLSAGVVAEDLRLDRGEAARADTGREHRGPRIRAQRTTWRWAELRLHPVRRP